MSVPKNPQVQNSSIKINKKNVKSRKTHDCDRIKNDENMVVQVLQEEFWKPGASVLHDIVERYVIRHG